MNIIFTYATPCGNSLLCLIVLHSGVCNRSASTLGTIRIQLTIVGRKNACIIDFLDYTSCIKHLATVAVCSYSVEMLLMEVSFMR